MGDNDTRLKESLSALMDDAADELETQRILKAIAEDGEHGDLRATWERYQLASSAMQKDTPAVQMDLTASVSAALADEPEHRQSSPLLKSVGRFAVAATVTLAVVVGVQQYNEPASVDAPAIATNNASNIQLPPGLNTAIDTRLVSDGNLFDPVEVPELIMEPASDLDEATKKELEQRLNELMERHTEGAALGGNQGLLPYARLPEKGQPEGK